MGDHQSLIHQFEPVYDRNSKILILGTFPSVKSREQQFYYGHPQNRFWKVLAALFCEAIPKTVEEKKKLLLQNHIAVWDVIKKCEIVGSSDSSIRKVIPSDVGHILRKCEIRAIFANGKKAAELYQRFLFTKTQVQIRTLPSTSPANAAYSLERLLEVWSVVKELS